MKLFINSILTGLLIGLILLILCCMTGCRHWKHVSKATTIHTAVRTDSTHKALAEHVSERAVTTTHREVKDTVVGVASASVVCADCADTVIRSGYITLRTYTDSKGKRHTECLADSLTLVIRGLVRERETLAHSRDSVLVTSSYYASQGREHTSTLTEVVKQTNRGSVFIIKHILYLLLAVLAGMGIQKWLVPFIKLISDHHGRIW